MGNKESRDLSVLPENVPQAGSPKGKLGSAAYSLDQQTPSHAHAASPPQLARPPMKRIFIQRNKAGQLGFQISSQRIHRAVQGTIHFVTVIDDGGPAALAGLKVGQIVRKVNDIPLNHLTHQEAVLKIREQPRTKPLKVLVQEADERQRQWMMDRLKNPTPIPLSPTPSMTQRTPLASISDMPARLNSVMIVPVKTGTRDRFLLAQDEPAHNGWQFFETPLRPAEDFGMSVHRYCKFALNQAVHIAGILRIETASTPNDPPMRVVCLVEIADDLGPETKLPPACRYTKAKWFTSAELSQLHRTVGEPPFPPGQLGLASTQVLDWARYVAGGSFVAPLHFLALTRDPVFIEKSGGHSAAAKRESARRQSFHEMEALSHDELATLAKLDSLQTSSTAAAPTSSAPSQPPVHEQPVSPQPKAQPAQQASAPRPPPPDYADDTSEGDVFLSSTSTAVTSVAADTGSTTSTSPPIVHIPAPPAEPPVEPPQDDTPPLAAAPPSSAPPTVAPPASAPPATTNTTATNRPKRRVSINLSKNESFETYSHDEYKRQLEYKEFLDLRQLVSHNQQAMEEEQRAEVEASVSDSRLRGFYVMKAPFETFGFEMESAGKSTVPGLLLAEPVRIKSIAQPSALAADGNCREGDRIVKINGQWVVSLPHAKYLMDIINTHPALDITITRNEPLPPLPDFGAWSNEQLQEAAFEHYGLRVLVDPRDGWTREYTIEEISSRFVDPTVAAMQASPVPSDDTATNPTHDALPNGTNVSQEPDGVALQNGSSASTTSFSSAARGARASGNRHVTFSDALPTVHEVYSNSEYKRPLDPGDGHADLRSLFFQNQQQLEDEQQREAEHYCEQRRMRNYYVTKERGSSFGFKLSPLPKDLSQGYMFLEGVTLTDIDPQGPLQRTDLREGDRLVKVNDQWVLNHQHATYLVFDLLRRSRALDLTITRDEPLPPAPPNLMSMSNEDLQTVALEHAGIRADLEKGTHTRDKLLAVVRQRFGASSGATMNTFSTGATGGSAEDEDEEEC